MLLRTFFLFCLLPAHIQAQETQESLVNQGLPSSYLVKTTLTLLIVVVIIFAIAWAFKRFNLSPQKNSGLIKVVGGMALGTRDRLMVVEIGEERLLLGLSPGRIEKLHTLKSSRPETGQTGNFADQLESIRENS